LTGQITVNCNITGQAVPAAISGLAAPTDQLALIEQLRVVFGSGAGQSNLDYYTSGSITGSGTTTIDLYTGLLNAYGGAVNLATIKGVILINTSGDQSSPTAQPPAPAIVMGNASNPFLGWFGTGNGAFTETINAGAAGLPGMSIHLDLTTGWAVTSPGALNLMLTNTSSTLTAYYDIILLGVSR
jgi:hypothetical protein